MKFRHSLLARYLMIIIAALVLWPLVLPIYYLPDYIAGTKSENLIYSDPNKLKQMWLREADHLDGLTANQVNERLQTLKKQYPKANIFWVDASGKTRLMLPKQANIPKQWTLQGSVEFIQKNVGQDLFTIVSYIGQNPNQGFMVFQVPHSLISATTMPPENNISILIFINLVMALFLLISWLFFSKVRKRLVRLQLAMTQTDLTGIPKIVTVTKRDEIGQLEQSFNSMINELESGRKREQEQEALRKKLIANLSHDLRTPLTTIRGHAYSLQKEPLSSKGKGSLLIIENKVEGLSQLIDNLLSYTLLSAGKYPRQKKEMDIIRIIQTAMAAWYPVFEKEGFEVEICLLEEVVLWEIDPLWFTRILDNLFQNAIRHAQSGQYIGIYMEKRDGRAVVIIEDKGPGIKTQSSNKGIGIGLSIVSLMLKEMNLDWSISTSSNGTRIYLYEKN